MTLTCFQKINYWFGKSIKGVNELWYYYCNESPEHKWCWRFFSPMVVLYIYLGAVMHSFPHVPIFTTPLFIVVLCIAIKKLYCKLGGYNFKDDHISESTAKSRFFTITIAVFILYGFFLAYGGVETSPDTQTQWEQVMTGSFTDWHPVIHTYTIYVFAKIVRYYPVIILCFMGCFAITCGWLNYSLNSFEYEKKKSLLLLLLIVASPVSIFIQRILWKDTAFGIAVLAISIALLNIQETQGVWLKKNKNVTLLIGLLVYASFVRHNGIFFTIPFIILLPTLHLSQISKTRIIVITLLSCLCICGYIGIRKVMVNHGYIKIDSVQTFSEAVGLPMSMMAEVLVTDPKSMPEDAKTFMYRIAPQKTWEEYYNGDFNSVKSPTWPLSNTVFSTITPKDFFTLFLKTCLASPKASMRSFRHMTSLGLDPFFNEVHHFTKRDLGFYQKLIVAFCGWIFYAPGLWVLLLVISSGYAIKHIGWNAVGIALPYISYTIGTSLLLTGWDHRFFYAILIGIPPIVLMLLGTNSQARKTSAVHPRG